MVKDKKKEKKEKKKDAFKLIDEEVEAGVHEAVKTIENLHKIKYFSTVAEDRIKHKDKKGARQAIKAIKAFARKGFIHTKFVEKLERDIAARA